MSRTLSAAATGLPNAIHTIGHSLPRRGFLLGLVSLPLIGGAIELLGNPQAVAMEATDQFLFEYGKDGQLVAGEAQERQTAGAAESAARRMAETAIGALAFSRTGDPATGEFEDALVLRSFGEVPSLEQLSGAD